MEYEAVTTILNFMTSFSLLSPALCLQWDNGSYLTVDSLSVVSYAPVHSTAYLSIGLTVARLSANSWSGRVIIRVMRTVKHTRCRWPDLTWLSIDLRDCIRYKNPLKLFIHLRSSSKSVTAWFAAWNPANWHENQIEIRSKTLLIPQTLRTRAGSLVAS